MSVKKLKTYFDGYSILINLRRSLMGALANYVVCILMNIQPPAMYILTAGGLLGFSLLETWIYAAQKKKELDSGEAPLLDNEDPEVDQNAEDE